MSSLEEKLRTGQTSEGKAVARLKDHLAYRGYIVKEGDRQGPVLILVNGADLSEWRRLSKIDGKNDFNMELVSTEEWSHEWPSKSQRKR